MATRTFRDRFLSVVSHIARRLPIGRRSVFQACRWLAGNPERFVLKTDGQYFVVDCLDEDVAMRVALNRAYEPVVAALFMAHVKRGDVVLDIGANKGYYVLLATSRVGPSGKVIAYEPDLRNVADLQRDTELNNLGNVTVSKKGLSDRNGLASFSTDGWKENNSAWGRIITSESPSSQALELEIETCTLDEELTRLQIDHVDVLKMDIQGGERAAIDGMECSLAAGRIGVFLLELHDNTLSKAECEYILNRIRVAGYTGKYYEQSDFTDAEALASLRGGPALDLSSRGRNAETYDFDARDRSAGYCKPYQFIFSRARV